VKLGRRAADVRCMLALLTVLTAGYFAALFCACWRRLQQAGTQVPPTLPAADLPPASAVGWPPQGARFTRYVDDGVAALDAYLDEDFAA
jgi:hypothetical protein